MPEVARLQSQRRIVLPEQLTEHMGVKEGDMILLTPGKNGRVVLCAADVRPRE